MKRIFAAFLIVAWLFTALPVGTAFGDETEATAIEITNTGLPSVLLVDASLGDFEAFGLHWLSDTTTEVATSEGYTLLTGETNWWNAEGTTTDQTVESETSDEADTTGITSGSAGATAPSTFLLGSPAGNPIEAKHIAWALDEIAKSGAEPETVVVSLGASGLQARMYGEDLAEPKQSSRADLVGMVFLGTPHMGYSVAAQYPKLELWTDIATASNLQPQDVLPGSDYLNALNAAPLPNIIKTLQINGAVEDMGFGLSDGTAVEADMTLPDTVCTQVQTATARSTVSQGLGLSNYWLPQSKTSGTDSTPVDGNIAERLSAMESYITDPAVRSQVKDFYQLWFGEGVPVTHVSSVLTLDLSGSMLEHMGAGDRLDAAKAAAENYMQAVDVRSGASYSVPTDLSVLGFNTSVTDVASGSDEAARQSLDNLRATDETNIGIALEASLDKLDAAPRCAQKRILLLSDGATTRGQSNADMLAGSIAEAKAAGIAIDTVAFGNMGESDVGFLQEIATQTNGTFYESGDAYSLQLSFLKSYYSSIGLNIFDAELDTASGVPTVLANLPANTRVLEIGVLAEDSTPAVKLLLDGAEVAADLYSTQADADGLMTLQLENPAAGEYSIIVEGATTRAHVFAVSQANMPADEAAVAAPDDMSFFFIVGAAALLVIGLIALVVRTLVLRGRDKTKAEKG